MRRVRGVGRRRRGGRLRSRWLWLVLVAVLGFDFSVEFGNRHGVCVLGKRHRGMGAGQAV